MRPERIEPRAGQESVWDYPRPPRLERSDRHISHPPVYYLPPADLKREHLIKNPRTSFCEWKGRALYADLRVGERVAPAAGWYYPDPTESFQAIQDHVAFYPGAMDRCTVDGEIVRPQPGGFYGGWITSDVVGPFKGEPGTEYW
jgi:uncharacterized protein (DUF427 family)